MRRAVGHASPAPMGTPTSVRRLARVTAAAATLQLAACGGSASETPPPLEPDFARLARVQGTSVQPADAGAEDEQVEVLEDEARPAPDTWGSAPAPKRFEPK